MKTYFRKVALLLTIAIFTLLSVSQPVLAQSELLFGQDHSYSVVFRGNGEAITYAKLVVTNPDNKPLTEFSFEVPKVTPTEMAIYQMKLPQTCVQYGNDYGYPGSTRGCVKYQDPDYANAYYYGDTNGKAEYTKIDYSKSGNLYRFTLPTPVQPYKSTAIVVAYAAKGYVKNVLGLSTFNFETLKVPSRIQSLRVAVDVDSDLILKGKKAEVNYTSNDSFGTSAPALSKSMSSPELDNVVRSIGSYGSLVKEAKNLSPNESYTIKGEYASNWFRLYLKEILFTIVILVGMIVGLTVLTKVLKRRYKSLTQTAENKQELNASQPSLFHYFNVTTILLSFGSVALTTGFSFLILFLQDSNLWYLIGYNPLFSLLCFFASAMLYGVFLLGPIVYVTSKQGWKAFLAMLLADFLWFLVFLLLIVLFFHLGSSRGYTTVQPMMDEVLYK